MHKLLITPQKQSSEEEKAHNRALLEKYMPELPDRFRELREVFGKAKIGTIKIDVSDNDLSFVQSNMDNTKRLIKLT